MVQRVPEYYQILKQLYREETKLNENLLKNCKYLVYVKVSTWLDIPLDFRIRIIRRSFENAMTQDLQHK